MNERIDSDLPESLRRVVQEYHPPPDTPRDAMWARIVAARSAQPTAEESPNALPFRPAARRRLVVWGVGIAAALLVAFGLGRRSVGTASNGGVATPTIAAEAPSLALRLAAADHLARTETFLTMLRTDALEDGLGFTAEARDLLVSTRLMIDSPASADPKLRALLLDLEFVLVQLVQLDQTRRQEELELIADGMEQQQVLPRIRTAIPAGPTAT